MSHTDLKGTLPKENDAENDERQAQLQVNSLDFLVSVDRLPIFRSNAKGIYLFGPDNNYPRKIIQSADRSNDLVTARNKQAQFVQGLGFPGATAMDVKNNTAVVINSRGQTAYDLLKFCANQKSNINIAIHINYNALGEGVEFNLIQYDFVRRKIPTKKDEKFIRYIITNIWHLENDFTMFSQAAKIQNFNVWVKNKSHEINFTALECFDYNPNPIIVREQIEISGGIENYPGQLFYMKRTEDVYQKAFFDSVSDKFQFLAETDLSSLSNVQNAYNASGVFKYFGNMDNTKEIEQLKLKLANVRGSKNFGRIVTVPVNPNSENRIPDKMFESTEMTNIDKLYAEQIKNAESGIQFLYSIPSILIGKDTTGNFATQRIQEAFDFYNSITEPLRQELEIELTTLFVNSIFASQITLPIEIGPLQFVSRTKIQTKTNEPNNNNE